MAKTSTGFGEGGKAWANYRVRVAAAIDLSGRVCEIRRREKLALSKSDVKTVTGELSKEARTG
jgi:hypothetical protein